jgi:hypothetical protein
MYRIYSLTNDKVYVGSTIDFYKRRIEHKCNCYNEKGKKYNFKLYRTIRQYDGWNYFIMEIIETFICNTKQERLQREKELMLYYRVNLNSRSAFRTNEERIQNQKIYRNNIKNESPEKREIRRRKKEQRIKMKIYKQMIKEDIENDIYKQFIV